MRFLFGCGILLGLSVAQETGNHPDWPRWCGKVYKQGYPSFDPGGQTLEPPNLPDGPALHVQFKPRYSIYLESESEGEFVVRAEASKWYGDPWPNVAKHCKAPPMVFTIKLLSNDAVLVSSHARVGSKPNLFAFNLTGLEPSFDPYQVVLFGATEDGAHNLTASSEFYLLPEKKTGSVTKLDHLNGSIAFRNPQTAGKFESLLPYGFYASCDGFLCAKDNLAQIQRYYDLGLHGMVPLTTIFDSKPAFQYMDKLDLKFMYDLRGYYKNLTAVHDQVSAVKDFDALYAYWGADEPDGKQEPFDLTVLSRDVIRKIDPYHPVSVTLNCQNFYFKEYTAAADLIMEDVYPIAINSTFSKWGTACTPDLGDCGCDNCDGTVMDVSNRLDDLAQYEQWLGLWPKTKAHNPQSFHGEDYWFRDPTVEEEVVMNALAFNHGAKAIVSWVWPTSDALAEIHGKFANVVTKAPVRDFIVPEQAHMIGLSRDSTLDVAYWVSGNEVLLSVVNGGDVAIHGPLSIPLPTKLEFKSKKAVVWGQGSWKIQGQGHEIVLDGIDAMSTNMVILGL